MRASRVSIPTTYPALRKVFGEHLDEEHSIARLMGSRGPRGPEAAAWIDSLYQRVFANGQIYWQGDRRQRLCECLRVPESFAAADAEVQVAANLLRRPEVSLIAQAEGMASGVRVADFLLDHPHKLEIEVRAIMGLKADVDEERIEASLLQRLTPVVRGRSIKAILRVRRVRDNADAPLLLDPRAEKQLVSLVSCVVAGGDWQSRSVYVTLPASGDPRVFDDDASLDGELASVEIASSAMKGFLMNFGGLRKPPGEEEVRRALSRKRARGQRTDQYPWVVVLDVSNVPMLDAEQMQEAIRAAFRTSRSLSAVVIQRRGITTPGLGLSPTDAWFAQFESRIATNAAADRALPEGIVDLFATYENHLL